MNRWIAAACLLGMGSILGAEPPPVLEPSPAPDAPAEQTGALKEVFPGVLLDKAHNAIELPGRIPIMADVGDDTVVFLEQLVCTPNTREHEVLAVVSARPSHVHAALLVLGLEPGRPASWTQEDGELIPHDPEGPELEVEFRYKDDEGVERTARPTDWVVNYNDRSQHLPDKRLIFAGSAMKKLRDGTERYMADGEGTIVGLASFCTEVIAWPSVFSPEASRHEPEWIAIKTMPKVDTPVTVRISIPPKDAREDEAPSQEPGAPASGSGGV